MEFAYLGSTIHSSLSLDAELNKHIGKAAANMARLSQEGLGENHAEHQHEDADLLNLRPQHAALWQQNMDPLLPPRAQLNSLRLSYLRRILGIT